MANQWPNQSGQNIITEKIWYLVTMASGELKPGFMLYTAFWVYSLIITLIKEAGIILGYFLNIFENFKTCKERIFVNSYHYKMNLIQLNNEILKIFSQMRSLQKHIKQT